MVRTALWATLGFGVLLCGCLWAQMPPPAASLTMPDKDHLTQLWTFEDNGITNSETFTYMQDLTSRNLGASFVRSIDSVRR